MSKLAEVGLPTLENFSVQIKPPALVQLLGVIAIAEPGRVLSAFFAGLHRAACEDRLREVSVDVRHLTFVNSSAIRLFVDWTTWLRNLGPSESYTLRFRTDRRITWQRTSFSVLQTLAPNAIVIDAE
ncbi:MAG TPA: hypothetical protein VHV51_06280 [Polyangiaceae bacterium]|jgi:hypothetical protein|nr:hypothetical protein [Polyangiaceae bacterium]